MPPLDLGRRETHVAQSEVVPTNRNLSLFADNAEGVNDL